MDSALDLDYKKLELGRNAYEKKKDEYIEGNEINSTISHEKENVEQMFTFLH